MARLLVVGYAPSGTGGSCCLTAWALQALLDDGHTVEFMCPTAPDLERANALYGTRLPTHLCWRPAPPLARRFQALAERGLPLWLLANHLMWRSVRRLRRDYALIISLNNESDLGPGVLEYIHFPRDYRPRPEAPEWLQRPPFSYLLAAYYRLCRRLSGSPRTSPPPAAVLCNSAWTARLYQACHGREARVLWPPAPGDFPHLELDQRAETVTCVGRFGPEKRLDLAVSLVERARRACPGLTLTLVGPTKATAEARRLMALADRRPWLQVRRGLSRTALTQLLAQTRIGLHAMVDEHYGIAVAEYIRAGCLPLVHDSGGPAELLADCPELRYQSSEQAVERLVSLCRDPSLVAGLRPRLQKLAARLEPEAFIAGFQEAVRGVLDARAGACP